MAYKQKINPRTGKFDMVANGGGGEGGKTEVTSVDKSVSVKETSDGVDLSVRPLIKSSIAASSDNDKFVPSVQSVIDYVNQERGRLEMLWVNHDTENYKRLIEVSPDSNTTYYRLTAMVMGGSGNPDYYGMLEVSFGYRRGGSNPNYCYAYWLTFTEGDPSKQTYKIPPIFKIWVSSDQKKVVIGAKCPANYNQGLELHIVTENTVGNKIHGTSSEEDVISADFIASATEVEIVNLSPAADEEDLTASVIGKLQLKDREATTGSMGYVILRKDKTFAEQVTKANTIYEIRYEFDLNGGTVVIPENCVLKFEGGCVNEGLLRINSSNISAIGKATCHNLGFSIIGNDADVVIKNIVIKGITFVNDKRGCVGFGGSSSLENVSIIDCDLSVSNKAYNCMGITPSKNTYVKKLMIANNQFKYSRMGFEANTWREGAYISDVSIINNRFSHFDDVDYFAISIPFGDESIRTTKDCNVIISDNHFQITRHGALEVCADNSIISNNIVRAESNCNSIIYSNALSHNRMTVCNNILEGIVYFASHDYIKVFNNQIGQLRLNGCENICLEDNEILTESSYAFGNNCVFKRNSFKSRLTIKTADNSLTNSVFEENSFDDTVAFSDVNFARANNYVKSEYLKKIFFPLSDCVAIRNTESTYTMIEHKEVNMIAHVPDCAGKNVTVSFFIGKEDAKKSIRIDYKTVFRVSQEIRTSEGYIALGAYSGKNCLLHSEVADSAVLTINSDDEQYNQYTITFKGVWHTGDVYYKVYSNDLITFKHKYELVTTEYKQQIKDLGKTTERPTTVSYGFQYYDTDLRIPIWWNGKKWVEEGKRDIPIWQALHCEYDVQINTYVTLGSVVDITKRQNSTGTRCVVVECNSNDLFRVSGRIHQYNRLWAFLDSEMKLIKGSGNNISGHDVWVKAPSNSAYFVVNDTDWQEESYVLAKYKGLQIYDESLSKYVMWNGTEWIDAVTPTLTTGTEIADINGTKIYAPIPGANVLFPQNGYIPVAGLNSGSVLRVHFATETYPDICLSYFSKNFAPNLVQVGSTLELDVTTDVTIERNLQLCVLGSIGSHIEQFEKLPVLSPNKLYRITVTVTAVGEYAPSAFSLSIQTIE